jgi:hypothetical protein
MEFKQELQKMFGKRTKQFELRRELKTLADRGNLDEYIREFQSL